MKIDINNYEAFLIDYMEGRLNTAEIQQLKAFCAQNQIDFEELTEDLPVLECSNETYDEKENLFKSETIAFDNIDDDQYKLEPDTSIVFKDKDSLKKKAIILPLYAKIAAAVAVIALLFGLFWLPKTENISTNEQSILVELTPETAEPIADSVLIPTENLAENLQDKKCDEERNKVSHYESENVQAMTSEGVANVTSINKQAKPTENDTRDSSAKNETDEIQQIRIKSELLASLEPRTTLEIIVSEDFAIENGLLPEMAFLLPANDYYLNQNQEWADEDDYEYYEQHLSLIGRGISWLSKGRYTSIGEAIGDGLRIGRREVVELSEQAVAIAYIKTDESLNEIKAKWEERLERKDGVE